MGEGVADRSLGCGRVANPVEPAHRARGFVDALDAAGRCLGLEVVRVRLPEQHGRVGRDDEIHRRLAVVLEDVTQPNVFDAAALAGEPDIEFGGLKRGP